MLIPHNIGKGTCGCFPDLVKRQFWASTGEYISASGLGGPLWFFGGGKPRHEI